MQFIDREQTQKLVLLDLQIPPDAANISGSIGNKYGDGSQIGGCYKKKQSALQHLQSAVEVSL